MDIKKLIDVCVRIRPRITVIVNLFGEVHLPVEDSGSAPAPPAGMRSVHSYYDQQERRRADDE